MLYWWFLKGFRFYFCSSSAWLTFVVTVSFVNPGFTCFPAELGDYDDVQHSSGYVSEFRFVAAQSEEMENDVEYAHASMAGVATNSIFLLGFCKNH